MHNIAKNFERCIDEYNETNDVDNPLRYEVLLYNFDRCKRNAIFMNPHIDDHTPILEELEGLLPSDPNRPKLRRTRHLKFILSDEYNNLYCQMRKSYPKRRMQFNGEEVEFRADGDVRDPDIRYRTVFIPALDQKVMFEVGPFDEEDSEGRYKPIEVDVEVKKPRGYRSQPSPSAEKLKQHEPKQLKLDEPEIDPASQVEIKSLLTSERSTQTLWGMKIKNAEGEVVDRQVRVHDITDEGVLNGRFIRSNGRDMTFHCKLENIVSARELY